MKFRPRSLILWSLLACSVGLSCAAEDLPHWSLQPLIMLPLPGGEGNPLDRFLRAKLVEKGLAPAPPADARTLIRRLSYDLTGLPPSPEEVMAFVENRETYPQLVERLLASPRHGEHWARHWLDVAHYADTHGNDHDHARPNAWPYRDYVIRAFNEDKPYPRFVQEQVAGDALFPDDPQATVALGFLAAGPWDDTLMVTVREDTFDHHLAQVLDRDDMVTTVMSTFQSVTVHCARCHDHKFDPISQREYYALQAVFAGVDRADRPFDDEATTQGKRRELLRQKSAIARRDPTVMASLETPEVQQKLARLQEAQTKRRDAWLPLEVVSIASASGADTVFSRQDDATWYVSGARPEKDTFIVTARTNSQDLRALRLEALPDDRLPGRGPGRYEPSGNFHLTEFRVLAAPSTGSTTGGVRVEFARATADHSDRGDVIANAIDGRPDTHWSIHPRYGEAHEAVFEFKEPLGYAQGTTFIIRLEHLGAVAHQLGHFRLSVCNGNLPADQRAPLPITITETLHKLASQQTTEERRELALQVLAAEVEGRLAALPPPQMVYAVTHDFPANGSFKPTAEPRPIHLLKRGDLNQPAESVASGALSCLPDLGAALAIVDGNDEANRRAALAQWLTDGRNVLTWRSIVNRVWHYHFGRGLCDTPNDFGKMGGVPSHPELLDWLAGWFRDEAHGSLKKLHRLIVTSATYQQSSFSPPPTIADFSDSDNRLLWRMNRTRLTAEEFRDSLLQISGQLDLTMGGPGAVQFVDHGSATFHPPGGDPAFLDYDHFPPDAPANRRRSIYRFIFRTVSDPLMDVLDAPDGGALTPVRSQSTTALQALALLNNPFIIRQCELIAERIQKLASPGNEIATAFHWLLQREPRADELANFSTYSQKHSLTNACHVMVNGNEFLYLD